MHSTRAHSTPSSTEGEARPSFQLDPVELAQLQARWQETDAQGVSERERVLAELEELKAEGGLVMQRRPDLRGIVLIEAELDGLDFTGVDLSGCDLSGARLERAVFLKAKLTGATLYEARLMAAELSGADLAGANLENAHLDRAGLGHAVLEGASLIRARLRGATLTEANLKAADLRGADLQQARLRGAQLERAHLAQADLREVDLEGAGLGFADFSGCDLRGSSLKRVRQYTRARWIGVDTRDIDFTGAHLCRRHILDENFLDEFRRQGRWSEVLYRVWWLSSDCGRSLVRWSALTVALALFFAGLYGMVSVDYGGYPTWLSPLYYSVVTLTTLGYGDVLPASVPAQCVAMAEVVTGYVMLGGLLSIFSNKMARRAE